MANQRSTFSKRRREQALQERARAKQERRTARRNEPRTTGAPRIAWDEAVNPVATDDRALPAERVEDGAPGDGPPT